MNSELFVVESSEHNQVIFENVPEVFPEGKPIECQFRLTGTYKVEVNDFIGLFKVGFSNYREFLHKLPITMEMLSRHQLSGKLIFPLEQVLPKLIDGEFYQFVYVSNGKYIRGVSIPFTYKKVSTILGGLPSKCNSCVDLHKPASKEFTQVIFECVPEYYPVGRQLECLFKLNGTFRVEPTDFIGIFKVGFSSPREYLTQVPIPMEMYTLSPSPLDKYTTGKLIFTQEQLPKLIDGEFYQFVYVSNGKYIRGVSIPFTFGRVHGGEPKWHSYEKLIQTNENVMKMLKEEFSNKIKSLKIAMESEPNTSTTSSWKQSKQHEDISTYTQMLHKLNGEIQLWKGKFDEVSIENHDLLEQLQRRVQQIDSLRGELELLRLRHGELSSLKQSSSTFGEELRRISDELRLTNEKMIRWEREFEEKCVELNKIKIDLRKNEMLVEEQTQTIKSILKERDSLMNQIQILKTEKIELVQTQEWISRDLLMVKERLVQAERYRDMYKIQLETLKEELEVRCGGVVSSINWVELMQKMEQEWILREKQMYGSYYSLQYANAHLTKRIQTQSIESNEQKTKIVELMNENELLQDKLRNGAFEYACLNKKYVSLVNNGKPTSSSSLLPVDFSSSIVLEQPRQMTRSTYLPESMKPTTMPSKTEEYFTMTTSFGYPVEEKSIDYFTHKPSATTTTTTTTVEYPIKSDLPRVQSVECLIPSTSNICYKPTPNPRQSTTQLRTSGTLPTTGVEHITMMVPHKPEYGLERELCSSIRGEPIHHQSWSNGGEKREFVKTPFGDYHLNY